MTTTDLNSRLGAAADLGDRGRAVTIAAGILAIGLAIYQVAKPGAPDGAIYESVWDYVRELGFLGFLLTSAAAVEVARRRNLAPRRAGLLVPIGYGLIAAGVTAGLIVREELDWFFVLAGPGLLLSAVGFVAWAVWARRGRVLPSWAIALLAVGGLTAIVMSELGTSVLIGSFWLFLATTFVPQSPSR